jgi:sugar phosphate isomerase/epimerase
MKISFSSLGCPGWDLDTICRLGQAYGYDGVDFRGYLDQIDITKLVEFTKQGQQTRRMLDQAGLVVSGISSSIKLCVPELRQKNLDEAQRTIEVAINLGAHNIRVFGGGDLTQFTRDELVDIAQDCMKTILLLDGAHELKWLFETHDIWFKSRDCSLLLDCVVDPAFGALWDISLPLMLAGELPQETYATIGERINYTHLKDAVNDPGHPLAMEFGWRYVPAGTGQVPLAEAVHILQENGYSGWLMFEHEKRWIPGLPEPEEALPQFVEWARSVIG